MQIGNCNYAYSCINITLTGLFTQAYAAIRDAQAAIATESIYALNVQFIGLAHPLERTYWIRARPSSQLTAAR